MEMRVGRHIFANARDAEQTDIAQVEALSDRVIASEVFQCHGFGQNDGLRLFEHAIRVALQQGYGKEIEEIGIGKSNPLFQEALFTIFDKKSPIGTEPRVRLHARVVAHERGACGSGRTRDVDIVTTDPAVYCDPEDAVGILVKAVVAQLMLHEQEDKHAGRQPDGQSENINGSESLLVPEAPQSNFQITGYHNCAGYGG